MIYVPKQLRRGGQTGRQKKTRKKGYMSDLPTQAGNEREEVRGRRRERRQGE